MKRTLWSAVTIVMVMGVSFGEAQAQRRVVPFAGGGLATGMKDLSEGTDNGWSAFAGIDIPLPSVSPALSVGVAGSYSHLPYAGIYDEATSVSAIVGELGYVFGGLSSVVKPYVRGGLGAQLRKYDPGTTGFREQSEGGLALSGGAGVQFLVASTAIFVGAHVLTDAVAGVLTIHGGIGLPGRAR